MGTTPDTLAPLEPAKKETTSGRTLILPGQSPAGEYVLSVLVKRTYVMKPDARCERAEADEKIIAGDVPYDGPMNSSIKFEADFVPWKLGTDVVFNGSVRAPEGMQITGVKPRIKVGEHVKEILVLGDRPLSFRSGKPPVFGDPEPFERMEIRYERAFGGVDVFSDPSMQAAYMRNHLGKGFVVKNEKEAIEATELPNIEDPADPLTPERLCVGHFMHWERQPMPQGFGWFAKHWRPRSGYAGVMPCDRPVEQELRAMYRKSVPKEQREMYDQTGLPDMDFRFFSGASQGLAVPFLKGDEEVELKHLTASRLYTFRLPGETPKIGIDIGKGPQIPEVVLHTVQIRSDDERVDLVWRGAIPYEGPDWLPQMKKLELSVE